MAQPDFTSMTPDQFADWHRANTSGTQVEGQTALPGTPEPVSPPPTPPQARPASEVWGSDASYDFTAPSGATCRLRKLAPEKLIETGLLDKLTRLPGLAQGLIDKAEGKPPVKAQDEMAGIKAVLEILQELLPIVVVEPQVYRDPAEGEEKVMGRIYVSSIDLNDRLAIMNEITKGVTAMDSFRAES